jgi:hypothetical protein
MMAMGAVAIHYMSTWQTVSEYIWLMKKVNNAFSLSLISMHLPEILCVAGICR